MLNSQMDNQVISTEDPFKIYEETHSYTFCLSKKSQQKLLIEEFLCSQKFPETESKWKGRFDLNIEGHIVNLKFYMSSIESIQVKHTLFILYDDNIMENKQGDFIFEGKEIDVFECVNLSKIAKQFFFEKQDSFKIKVILTIQEDVLKTRKPFYETKEDKSNETLKNDLKMLLDSKKFSDFVIKLNDSSEILVHKAILAARSPVFSAMFQNDSSEKYEGCVNITDVEKGTMALLLNFIYTGTITCDLSSEQARKLFSAADKYEILDLKKLCGKYLVKNLELSNAVDTLLFAELHQISELKTYVFEFILDNKKYFSDVAMFEKVVKSFPNLLAELMMKMFTVMEAEKDKAETSK